MESNDKKPLAETGMRLDPTGREHDDELPLSFAHQVDRITANIKFYLSLLIRDMIPLEEV